MMRTEWNTMGCGDSLSEFDCMLDHYSGNNREAGNQKFETHWSSWINPGTVQSVHDVGLNTIRIPIGYWSYTNIVDKASEPFADGDRMLKYLDAVVQKAADLGIYVIVDFHGAPGGQQQDVFTGQNPNPAGFFNDYNFGRAEKWLTWMTNRIHTNSAYSSVGMIEVLNEPVSRHDANNRYPAPGEDPGLVQTYYPGALKAVRDAEAALNVADNKKLHVQFMSQKWDSGDPRANANVANAAFTAFDDHNYIGFALSDSDRGDQYKLMHSACTDSRLVSGEDYRITGEWSMTSNVDPGDLAFFKKWFTAQQQLYEKPGMDGWVFWTWKTDLSDPRWTYSDATARGYIPTNAAALEQNVFQDVCAGFR
jgi:glucan endo-1,6-beta-glucosidase